MTESRHEKTLRAQAAADEEFDAANALAFERDLPADPELAAAFAAATAARRAAAEHLERERAPDSLRRNVLALVEAPRAPRAPRAGRPLALAASIAVAAFFAGLLADRFLPGASPTPELRALVDDYAQGEISGQPFDVASSDRHVVKPWLASRVAFGAEAIDLADAGFPLAGGRIDVVAARPVPTLVYRKREHFIALSELPREAAPAGALTLDGYHVERWSDAERSYIAISDMDANELADFAEAFRARAAAPPGEDK